MANDGDAAMSVLQRWHHKVHDIPRGGVTQTRNASPELCTQVAEELGVPTCHELTANYRIRNAGKGRFELSGRVRAKFTRTCVITLEPIEEIIDEPLDCAFLPCDQIPSGQSDEEQALSVEELEPITHDTIGAGRIIYEVVAASIAPYPRAPDASLEPPTDEREPEQPAEHPFAALAHLKSTEREPE